MLSLTLSFRIFLSLSIWNTLSDFYGQCVCLDAVLCNDCFNHTGACVNGLGQVENEVANAIVDGFSTISLYRL